MGKKRAYINVIKLITQVSGFKVGRDLRITD